MAAPDDNLDTLLEMERFVRLMGVASRPAEIVSIVGNYLASWPRERIRRLQASAAGWVPFDDCQRAFPVSGVDDLRKIWNSLRIRCRELEVSGRKIGPELVELDLFLYFAQESLETHRPDHAAFAVARNLPPRNVRPPLESVRI